MTHLARIISYILSPYFLIISAPYFVIYRMTGQPDYAMRWTLYTGFFVLLVFLLCLWAVREGYFSNLDVSRRRQRPLLFGFIGGVSLMYLLSIWILHGPFVLFLGAVSLILSIIILSIINTRIKASFHVASITALIIGFGLLYGGVLMLALLLIPFVAWSRVKIHRHTVQEVVAGCLFGAILTISLFFLYNYIGVVTL